MRLGKVSAIAGSVAGLLGIAATAEVAHERRAVASARAQIDVKTAALFGSVPIDRESVVRTDDGLGLHVEEVGCPDAGLTMLFVHGLAVNLGSFHFQRQALARKFGDRVRQVFYDQRSHGRSEHSPAAGCTIEQTGRDLYSVIENIAPSGPLIVVGHSMGGMTVMALASQHPELFAAGGRVRAVVLINTSSGDLRNITLGLPSVLARLRSPVVPVLLRRAAKNAKLVERGRALGKDLAWLVTKRLSFADPKVDPAVVEYSTQLIAATPIGVLADFYSTLMEHDGRLGLQNLEACPVLVIGSDSDALTPGAHSELIAQALPAAQLLMVPNSGHLLMMEHPAAVNDALFGVVEDALFEQSSAGR